MGTKRDIGSSIKEKLNALEAAPDEMVWSRLQDSLDNKKKRRIVPLWFWFVGVGILFIGGFIGVSMNSVFENVNSNQITIDRKSSTSNGASTTPLDTQTDNFLNSTQPENVDVSLKETALRNNEKVDDSNNLNTIVKTNKPLKTKEEMKKAVKLSDSHISGSNNLNIGVVSQQVDNINSSGINKNVVFDSIKNAAHLVNQKEDLVNASASVLREKDSVQKIKKDVLDENLKKQEQNPWSVSVSTIFNSYDNFRSGSLLDPSLDSNQVSREFKINYGASLNYDLNQQWTIRTGANYVSYKQGTQNVDPSFTDVTRLNYVDYSIDAATLDMATASSSELEIIQEFTYLELPLQLRYSIYGNKIDIGAIGGLTYRLRLDDAIFVRGDSGTIEIGDSSTFYDSGVSAHVAFASRIKINKRFYFNIEPTYYFHIRPYETNRINSPSEFRVTTSLEYKF